MEALTTGPHTPSSTLRSAQAAGPLVARGAHVRVFLVAAGGRDDLQARAGSLDRNDIVLYASQTPRYSGIRYGARWTHPLNPTVATIREQTMNPGLLNRAYTAAFTHTLHQIDTTLDGARPPALVGILVLVGLLLVAGVLRLLLGKIPYRPGGSRGAGRARADDPASRVLVTVDFE